MGNNPAKTEGAYRMDPGQTALGIARRMATGRQTPVTVTFNSTRTMQQLADRIASQLQCSPEEFMDACAEVLPEHGFKRATYPAAFIPDTYEFYWSATPRKRRETPVGLSRQFLERGKDKKGKVSWAQQG